MNGQLLRVRRGSALLLACAALFWCAFHPVSLWAAPFRVLLINSYHPEFPTGEQIRAGALSVFEQAHIEFDVEYLDSKRHPEMVESREFSELLAFKFLRRRPYSAIMTSDDNALRFVMRNRERLFKGLPIVFCGVNDVRYALSFSGDPLITGVVEAVSMSETIDLAMRLNPFVRKVVGIVDSTASGSGDRQTFQALRDRYGEDRLDVLNLGEMSWREMGNRLQQLEADTVVLLLSAYVDAKGFRRDFEDGVRFIVRESAVPVYHLWRHGIGEGLVGGQVISHYHQAREAALRVLDILQNGKSPGAIPVLSNSPNIPLFDASELDRWGLDSGKLPSDTEFINEPPTLQRVLMDHIFVIIAIIGALVLAIMALVGYIVPRRRRFYGRKELMQKLEAANRELQDSHDYLQSILDALPAGLALLDCNGKIVGNNAAAYKWASGPQRVLRGESFFSAFPAVPLTSAMLDVAMARMETMRIANCSLRLSEMDLHADIMVYPIHSPEGDRAVIRCEDVSGKVRFGEFMVHSEKSYSMFRMASGVIDSVNNPMSAMGLDIQTLQRRLGGSLEENLEAAHASGGSMEIIRRYCEQRGIDDILSNLKTSCMDMMSIIGELSFFLKETESPPQLLSPGAVVSAAMSHAAQEHALSASGTDVNVRFCMTEGSDLAPVLCDAMEFEQLFLSLFKWHIDMCRRLGPSGMHRIEVALGMQDDVLTLDLHNRDMPYDESMRGISDAFAERSVRNLPFMGVEATLIYLAVVVRLNGVVAMQPHADAGTMLQVRIPL